MSEPIVPLSLGDRCFIALQHLLPQHGLSRLVHAAARSELPWFKNTLIRSFMAGFSPDLSDAVQSEATAYPSLNAFFTRALRAGTRPLPQDPAEIACPVDGTISEIGPINHDRLLQAKGRQYTLAALLAGREEWINRFIGGQFATIYLAPYNYHRIHMPLDGLLQEIWYIPGKLFSVNRTTANGVANVFARNERIACFFDAAGLPHALLMIGALNVGSMETVWHGEIAPRRPRQLTQLETGDARGPFRATRGEELGRFNMGSTVILLYPRDTIAWYPHLLSGRTVRMGEPLGRRVAP